MEEECLLTYICNKHCSPGDCKILRTLKDGTVDRDSHIYKMLDSIINIYNKKSIKHARKALSNVLKDPAVVEYTLTNKPECCDTDDILIYKSTIDANHISGDCLIYQTGICKAPIGILCRDRCNVYFPMSMNKHIIQQYRQNMLYFMLTHIPHIYAAISNISDDVKELTIGEISAEKARSDMYIIYLYKNYIREVRDNGLVYSGFIGYVMDRLHTVYGMYAGREIETLHKILGTQFVIYPLDKKNRNDEVSE